MAKSKVAVKKRGKAASPPPESEKPPPWVVLHALANEFNPKATGGTE